MSYNEIKSLLLNKTEQTDSQKTNEFSYENLIQNLQSITRETPEETRKAQVESLFNFLLKHGEYDYLYLEIERIKRITLHSTTYSIIDIERDETREAALEFIQNEISSSNLFPNYKELSEEFIDYAKNKEWESRTGGEKDTKYKNDILIKGVCLDYSKFIKKVLDEIGISCDICFGNTPLRHAWNIITPNNTPLHYDITYAMYSRDDKLQTNPQEWLGLTKEELLNLAPNRKIDDNHNTMSNK